MPEKVKTDPRIKIAHPLSGHFAEVVRYQGHTYDAHGGLTKDGQSCWCRLISENRFGEDTPPTHIRVDTEGNVVEKKTIDGKDAK
jgi:hypothetical protein